MAHSAWLLSPFLRKVAQRNFLSLPRCPCQPEKESENDDPQAHQPDEKPKDYECAPASGCFRNESGPKPITQMPIPTIITTGTAQFVQMRIEQSTATSVVKTKSDTNDTRDRANTVPKADRQGGRRGKAAAMHPGNAASYVRVVADRVG